MHSWKLDIELGMKPRKNISVLKAMKGDTIIARATWHLRNVNSLEQAGETADPTQTAGTKWPEGAITEWAEAFLAQGAKKNIVGPHYCEFVVLFPSGRVLTCFFCHLLRPQFLVH